MSIVELPGSRYVTGFLSIRKLVNMYFVFVFAKRIYYTRVTLKKEQSDLFALFYYAKVINIYLYVYLSNFDLIGYTGYIMMTFQKFRLVIELRPPLRKMCTEPVSC